MPNPRALCLGLTVHDVTFRLADFPEENRKGFADAVVEAGGGPAGTAAWLLATWGIPTAICGAVGDDLYGRRVLADFAAAGCDVSLMAVRPGEATGLSAILVNGRNGSRTIVTRRPPAEPRPSVEACAALAPALILFDGHAPLATAAALAACPGAIAVADAGSLHDGTRALCPRATHLVASERYAESLCGAGDLTERDPALKALRRIREVNGRDVAVTLGERGVIYLAADGSAARLRPPPVTAVDTTGAGDIFHGALAFALLRGDAFPEALALATAAAALSVTRPGARPSIPTLAEAGAALAARPPAALPL